MWKGCERTVFGLPELGFRWCLAFSDPLPTSFIFVSVQVRLLTCYGPLPVSCNGFEAAVSAACGRVANALFLAGLSLDLGAVWPCRIRCQRASFLSLCRLGCLPLRSFTIVNIFCVYIYMCYHVLHRTPHVDCQYPPPIRGVGGTWALAHSIYLSR